ALIEGARVAVVGASGPDCGLDVRRAGRARPGAGLREVALPSGDAADCSGVAHRVLADDAGAVALVVRAGVPVAGARGTRREAGVGGTRRADPRAGLRSIAGSGRRATNRGRRGEGAARGAAGSVGPVRRAEIALLHPVHAAVAALEIRDRDPRGIHG